MVGESILNYVESIWGKRGQVQAAVQTIPTFTTIDAVNDYYNALPPEVQNDPAVQGIYRQQALLTKDKHSGIENPLKPVILGMLQDWKENVKKYDIENPEKADEKLAGLASDVLAMSAAAGVVELALGAFPNGEGTVASAKVSQLMAWLGFGAVVTAVAHDPVKIGLLRPYQDSLEAHFRNRRPDDFALFQAYKTRELSPTKVEDLSKLNDTAMDAIEAENQKYYETEIAKWGYSEWFAGALSRSATITLNFSQLSALARQGLLTRGLAIYSLWGQGLDRTVMRPALDALMKQNEMASYEGFRSMIEPSFVDGTISEEDLKAYWSKIGVPPDVQGWVLPRLRKAREKAALKAASTATVKERDLTVSQVQQAYEASLIDRARAQNMILSLGYQLEEVKILLDLADTRRKLPASGTLKRLPLTDYEKAFKNNLISLNDVLQRMEGEYTLQDIALERKLLEIGKA